MAPGLAPARLGVLGILVAFLPWPILEAAPRALERSGHMKIVQTFQRITAFCDLLIRTLSSESGRRGRAESADTAVGDRARLSV